MNNQTQNGSVQAETSDKASQKMHETFDNLAHRAAIAEQYVREHASETAHMVRDKKPEVEQAIKKSTDKTINFIEHNPIMSTGIAFGAGILLTLLLRK